MKRRFHREYGAATVEFAITAVVLFLFVFGIIEFGLLMFDKHILTNASREGARAGIVMTDDARVSDAEIQGIVRAYAEEHMVSFRSSSALVFNPPISPVESSRVGDELFGTDLVVTVNYQFDFLLLSGFGIGPITLTAETRMKME
jgi:Flp pilus assembly protein TadG